MDRVMPAFLLVCAFAASSSAAVVDDAPLSTVAVQASAAKAIDFALVSPPVGDPASGATTCHYVSKRKPRSKGCNVCPRKREVFDSGRPCADPTPTCPRRFKGLIPCPDKNQKGVCKVKGKKPRCQNSD